MQNFFIDDGLNTHTLCNVRDYAAAVEGAKVREMINDRHFDFIPGSILDC